MDKRLMRAVIKKDNPHPVPNAKKPSKSELLEEFLSGKPIPDGNILAQLAAKIIDNVIIRGGGAGNRILQWNHRVSEYFKSPYSSIPKNQKDIAQARNNLNRVLAKKRLTWSNFMTIARISKARKIRFIVELEDAIGRVHPIEIEIPNHFGMDDTELSTAVCDDEE